ncbi:MAG: PhzF family phenazine biosynthesis isomerase [Vampirovibrionales bacterium]|nr:PhzF family phenazine biosynthesis isomerase [Vampirovibrionales bacterium]
MTQSVMVHTVRAFVTPKGEGGNKAGVVAPSPELSPQDYQHVAKTMGHSETAFVLPPDTHKPGDFKVRFFTPTDEVDLCGHATIGTFSHMAQTGQIKPGQYQQQTKAGVLDLEIDAQNTVWMTQAKPQFGEPLNTQQRAEVADALQLTSSDLDDALPAQSISTGVKELFVPLKSLKALHSIQPDQQKILALSKKHNVAGIYPFTQETQNRLHVAQGRNFLPALGIPEESATGVANGGLAAYLVKQQLVSPNVAQQGIILEQGHAMDLPSEIQARVALNANGDIDHVKVGGRAIAENQTEVKLYALV